MDFFITNNVYYIYYNNRLIGTNSLVNGFYYLNIDDKIVTNAKTNK